jgi:glutamine synthetase
MHPQLALSQPSPLPAGPPTETYIVAVPDLAGRLVGKRLTADFYHRQGVRGVRTCEVVFGWGLGHEVLDGFSTIGWERGYGDFIAVPDPATARPIAWWPATELVIADAVGRDGHPVAVAPRHVLQRQVRRANDLGFTPIVASELEFTLFEETAQSMRDKGHVLLTPHGQSMHPELVEGTGVDEELFAELRRSLAASGILVESIKSEYSRGQFELVMSAKSAVAAADDHAVFKLGVREICRRAGLSATFMAKWDASHGGSSCHLHVSLNDSDGRNAFIDDSLLRSFVGGLQRYGRDVFLLWAPYPNSYKRFRLGSFAPASLSWGDDNRTVALRVTGVGDSRHLENRVPGADVNPYLAYSGLLAAGLAGIEEHLQPDGGVSSANAYARADLPPLPATLDEAIETFATSPFTRERLGDDVVDHIVTFAAAERDAARLAVTDWDRSRLFEV